MAVVSSSRFNLKEGIESAINKYLEDYSEEVIQATEKIVIDVAKDSVNKLKAESPKREGKSKHQYSKGWTYKLDNRRLYNGAIIYGKKGTYNLAHLLEHGHALVVGGRKRGDVSAKVHIEPVEKWAIAELERIMVSELGG
jgi:hypothetical protein